MTPAQNEQAIAFYFIAACILGFAVLVVSTSDTVHSVLFLVLVSVLGQTFGLVLGALAHRLSPVHHPLPRWDRAAGAAVGAIGVLALLWMVIPSLATAQGWPARPYTRNRSWAEP